MAETNYTCGDCGFENHASCRFCIQCGRDLSGDAADGVEPVPNESPELPAERTVALLRNIAADAHFEHEEVKAGWKIKIPVGTDRHQTVYVTFKGHDDDGNDIVAFYSICGPADPAHAMDLLRLNNKVACGAFAVKTFQGKDYFVMTEKQLAETADAAELRHCLTTIADYADGVEKQLSAGTDVF